MQVKSKFELPWIEKYRPEKLDDIIDHTEKIETLRSLISRNELTHLIFYGYAGTGKCLLHGTPILMFDGTIKKVEDVSIGDQLMGDDSTPRKVLSTCNGQNNMYKIIPVKGQPWVCNEPHILCLKKSCKNAVHRDNNRNAYSVVWSEDHIGKCKKFYFSDDTRRNTGKSDICQTDEEAYTKAHEFLENLKSNPHYTDQDDIVEISVKDYLKKPNCWKNDYKLYKVKIEFPEKEVELDPYMLGYWLGGGTSENINREVLNYFRNKTAKFGLILKQKHTDKITYDIGKNTETYDRSTDYFNYCLRKYDLINNKHIPLDYKCNSRKVRLAILGGLIDSDGYYTNNCYEIVQKSEKLLDDIVYVVRSLGFSAEKKTVEKTYTNPDEFGRVSGTYYQCCISGSGLEEIPLLINYKQAHIEKQIKDALVSGFTIESVGVDEYYGFELDGNGRFVLGDFTVTHNTSLILACAREMYGDQYNRYILELNASDDRGIETVRKKIPDFVRSSSNKIRLVILDEVDAMTMDAQSALRRVIEKYSKSSRFCLICNNINKIIPGLQSRCTKMRFGYLKSTEICNKLSHIIQNENVKITEPALERLTSLNKDFRQILNTLQCLHIIKLNQGNDYPPIEPDEINEYLGIPTDNNVCEIVKILFDQSFNKACTVVNDLFKNNQWGLPDLIHKLSEYIIRNPTMPEKQKYFIIDRLSDIEFKLSHSNDAEVQLYALVGAFQQSLLIK